MQIKPINTPGVMLDKLPICNKDVLGLFLFMVPQLCVENKSLYHGKFTTAVPLQINSGHYWNAYNTDHFVAWKDEGRLYIQCGPYSNHVYKYDIAKLRLELWDVLTKDVPELERGELFLEVAAETQNEILLCINKYAPAVPNYHIVIDKRHGVSVRKVQTYKCEGELKCSKYGLLFSHYLCNTNVSYGTHGKFELNAFATTPYISESTEFDENYQCLGDMIEMEKLG